MEKVKKRYFQQYPMLRMFKDDLENIISLFEKDHKDAEIIVGEYKLARSSDIDNIGKSEVTNFSIQAFQRYHDETPYRSELLRLELNPHEAYVSVSDENDTHLRGIASQIDTILSRRRSRLHFLMGTVAAFIIPVIVLAPIYVILALPWSFSKQPGLSLLLTLLILILVALYITWMVVFHRIRTKRFVVIYLINSNAKSNYFSRNRDDLPKFIVGGLVTLLLGGVAYLINWLVHLMH